MGSNFNVAPCQKRSKQDGQSQGRGGYWLQELWITKLKQTPVSRKTRRRGMTSPFYIPTCIDDALSLAVLGTRAQSRLFSLLRRAFFRPTQSKVCHDSFPPFRVNLSFLESSESPILSRLPMQLRSVHCVDEPRMSNLHPEPELRPVLKPTTFKFHTSETQVLSSDLPCATTYAACLKTCI